MSEEYGKLRQLFPYNIHIECAENFAVINQEIFTWDYSLDELRDNLCVGSFEYSGTGTPKISICGAVGYVEDNEIYISGIYDDVYIYLFEYTVPVEQE